MQEKREKVFSIRLTQSEIEHLKETAEARGQTVGGYIRWVLFSKKEARQDG